MHTVRKSTPWVRNLCSVRIAYMQALWVGDLRETGWNSRPLEGDLGPHLVSFSLSLSHSQNLLALIYSLLSTFHSLRTKRNLDSM